MGEDKPAPWISSIALVLFNVQLPWLGRLGIGKRVVRLSFMIVLMYWCLLEPFWSLPKGANPGKASLRDAWQGTCQGFIMLGPFRANPMWPFPQALNLTTRMSTCMAFKVLVCF